jgi:hypothetical protein
MHPEVRFARRIVLEFIGKVQNIPHETEYDLGSIGEMLFYYDAYTKKPRLHSNKGFAICC